MLETKKTASKGELIPVTKTRPQPKCRRIKGTTNAMWRGETNATRLPEASALLSPRPPRHFPVNLCRLQLGTLYWVTPGESVSIGNYIRMGPPDSAKIRG